jgi:hypothetical protein
MVLEALRSRWWPNSGKNLRRRIERLELHVTHACNLACESCSHYSNHNHHGDLELEEADRWMAAWNSRVEVGVFHLLGGEPTIHPQLPAFVRLVRQHWPRTLIRIRTNGFFLHRHPELLALMARDRHISIDLAIHHDSPEYRRRLQPTMELIARWQKQYRVKIDVDRSFNNWTRRYQGFGETMQPFEDAAPRASWEICPARHSKQLFEGKLWKCAPLAYLKLQKAKYRLSEKWDPYLRYAPLAADCSERELDDFLKLEDELFCAMCSAYRRPLALPNPIRSAQANQTAMASAERGLPLAT